MSAPNPRVSTVPSASWVAQPEREPHLSPRLVIVISEVSEPATLARRILALTRGQGQAVVLLGVTALSEDEASLRRSLVAVEGFIASQGHRVELRTQSGRQWAQRVAALCQPDDQVACYEEVDSTTSWRGPLSDLLSQTLQLPVRDLTDMTRPVASRRSSLWPLAAWMGSIAAIGGFLFLQAKVVTTMQGWLQEVVLLLTLGPEVGLIWLWNSLLE